MKPTTRRKETVLNCAMVNCGESQLLPELEENSTFSSCLTTVFLEWLKILKSDGVIDDMLKTIKGNKKSSQYLMQIYCWVLNSCSEGGCKKALDNKAPVLEVLVTAPASNCRESARAAGPSLLFSCHLLILPAE